MPTSFSEVGSVSRTNPPGSATLGLVIRIWPDPVVLAVLVGSLIQLFHNVLLFINKIIYLDIFSTILINSGWGPVLSRESDLGDLHPDPKP